MTVGTSIVSGGSTIAVGGTTTVGTSTNVYPLTLPVGTDGLASGANVTIGEGPDTLTLQLSSDPGATLANGQLCCIAILMDGVPIAGPILITATGSSANLAGTLNIKGAWGPMPHIVTFEGAGQYFGVRDLWWLGGLYNFIQLWYNGPDVDQSTTTGVAQDQATVWNNAAGPTGGGTATTFSIGPYITPVVTVTNTGTTTTTGGTTVVSNAASVITGAAINGGTVAADTLANPIGSVAAGGTLSLPSGKHFGIAGIAQAMTIVGQGMELTGPGATANPNATVISGYGMEPQQDKAILVATAPGVVLMNMTIEEAMIDSGQGGNAAPVATAGQTRLV